jgi:hypothetical protein
MAHRAGAGGGVVSGGYVPAGPVRTHVQGLLDEGMSQTAICIAAGCSASYLSALLHGQYNKGRTPQLTMSTEHAARLLAVRYDGPAPEKAPRKPRMCAPGTRFEPVGYRVGRCKDCGQLAPVQTRACDSVLVMFAHLRPESGDPEPGPLPAPVTKASEVPAAHVACGTTKGAQRHRREHSELCEPCRSVQRGYDAGYKAAMTKAGRDARTAIPRELAEAVVAAMRAFLWRRPYPQLRELAVAVVRIADAELSDGGRRAA